MVLLNRVPLIKVLVQWIHDDVAVQEMSFVLLERRLHKWKMFRIFLNCIISVE